MNSILVSIMELFKPYMQNFFLFHLYFDADSLHHFIDMYSTYFQVIEHFQHSIVNLLGFLHIYTFKDQYLEYLISFLIGTPHLIYFCLIILRFELDLIWKGCFEILPFYLEKLLVFIYYMACTLFLKSGFRTGIV